MPHPSSVRTFSNRVPETFWAPPFFPITVPEIALYCYLIENSYKSPKTCESPFDEALHAAAEITGVIPKVAACDLGYRGAEITLQTQIHCFNRKRPVADELLPLKRRRPSIEPIIGHLKSDHSLGLNRLSGKQGCTINALLAAIGFNLRKLQRHLVRFLRLIFAQLSTSFPSSSFVLYTRPIHS